MSIGMKSDGELNNISLDEEAAHERAMEFSVVVFREAKEAYGTVPTGEPASQPKLEEELEQDKPDLPQNAWLLFKAYAKKFCGVEGKHSPKINPAHHIFVSSVLAFAGILLLAIIDHWFLSVQFEADHRDVAMLTGAQAATAVLVYEAFQSPLAQPRNVIGSYLVASFVGVSVRKVAGQLIGLKIWVVGAIAVGLSVAAMNITKTIHPPGGACALIAVIGGPNIVALEYGYMATTLGASVTMVALAMLGNNLIFDRQYPVYWI